MKKKIVCLEPWDGKGIIEYDTGLGNRFLHWDLYYYLSTLCQDMDIELVVPLNYWPELEFIFLPNTIGLNISSSEIKNKSVKITNENIINILKDSNISIFKCPKVKQYYSDQFFNPGCSPSPNIFGDGIKKIKFKDENINEFFKKNFSEFCSIHLRKGFGSNPSIGFLKNYLNYKTKDELKNYLNTYYFRCNWKTPHNFLLAPSDIVYFSMIEDFISNNKDQKFYISSDVPENYYSYYFEKYPHNLISRETYINEFLNLFDFDKIKDNKQTLINLFDLFVLSHSNTLVIYPNSTWGEVASLMCKEKTIIQIIDYTLKKENITYEEFVKKYSYYESTSIKSFLNKIR